MFVVALAILIGSMIILWVLSPETQFELFWLSTALLVVGLISAVSAVRLTNQWVRTPRPEEVLDEGLKGLGNNYILFHYWLPAHHVLVAPQGVFCITVCAQNGAFGVRGDRWYTRVGLLARLLQFFRQEQIGNPTRDATRSAVRVEFWIDRVIPDADVTVEPVVVFTAPGATFEAEAPTIPVLYADSQREPNLRDYVTGLSKDEGRSPGTTREQRRAIEAAALGSGE